MRNRGDEKLREPNKGKVREELVKEERIKLKENNEKR